ncbi:hypothetical protein EcE22_5526 [Escherichia coli E22]|nr:hypothetical protein EcE22_5526 [Escherichia coli E22]
MSASALVLNKDVSSKPDYPMTRLRLFSFIFGLQLRNLFCV